MEWGLHRMYARIREKAVMALIARGYSPADMMFTRGPDGGGESLIHIPTGNGYKFTQKWEEGPEEFSVTWIATPLPTEVIKFESGATIELVDDSSEFRGIKKD